MYQLFWQLFKQRAEIPDIFLEKRVRYTHVPLDVLLLYLWQRPLCYVSKQVLLKRQDIFLHRGQRAVQAGNALSVFESEARAVRAKAVGFGKRLALCPAYQNKAVLILRDISAVYCRYGNCRRQSVLRHGFCYPGVLQQSCSVSRLKNVLPADLPYIVCRFCAVNDPYLIDGHILRNIPIFQDVSQFFFCKHS